MVIFVPASAHTQRKINLAHNTHLRHIALRMYWGTTWAFTLLSQITSPLVDHVSLTIRDSCVVDWAQLDSLLTQQRWANLHRLSVRRIPVMPPEAAKLIRSRLSILESRGVVLDLVG
jgi:hypothetical protein